MFTSAYAVQQTPWFPHIPVVQCPPIPAWRCDHESFYHPGAPSGMRDASGVVLSWSEPLRPRIDKCDVAAFYRFALPLQAAGCAPDAAEHSVWHSHLYGPVTGLYNGASVQSGNGPAAGASAEGSSVAAATVDRKLVACERKPASRARRRKLMAGYLGAVVLMAGARFSAQVRQNPRARWWEAR
ncbi:hypothetical protein SAMN05216421_1740 [Halopseudomonas xinjiangensis]|uniref:Uncharacterized protein n=1 Tax=Halopseudomonas xinjiangensis TaxID=487184 RepID=A0A1H1T626_9GAMM|nr:hypothetical protein SAMN05216421_1740 [Halopseudomonas xinjiangensis]